MKRMSIPPLLHSVPATGRSPVVDDRSYPEVARGDQYPEVNREHEDLETARDYLEVNHNIPSTLSEKELPDQHGSRTGGYRILGLRPWVLVVLVCVVAIAVAIAVGLAIGIPASRRNQKNIDSAIRLPSADPLAAAGATSSQSFVESASPTVSSTSILSTSTGSTAEATSQSSSSNTSSSIIKCPANDTDIFATFTNGTAPDRVKSQPLKYRIHCNSDYIGTDPVHDMFTITVSSFTECINRCSLFNLQLPPVDQSFQGVCSGVTLVGDACYLKNGLTESAPSDLLHGTADSAILIWDDRLT